MALINVKLLVLTLSLLITVVLSVKQPRFKIDARIVGGQGPFKWYFPFFVTFFESRASFCGGAIISDFHILSAAHCFFSSGNVPLDPKNIIAVFGDTQLNAYATVANIESISIHEEYEPGILFNDIALLKTVNRIQFSQFVQPIPIAMSNFATNKCKATLFGIGFIGHVSVTFRFC